MLYKLNPSNSNVMPACCLLGLNAILKSRQMKKKLRGKVECLMAFQPPSLMFSSRIIGDVRVIVTCILGSTHEFKIIAASDTAHFMSYFSGLITYIIKSIRN